MGGVSGIEEGLQVGRRFGFSNRGTHSMLGGMYYRNRFIAIKLILLFLIKIV